MPTWSARCSSPASAPPTRCASTSRAALPRSSPCGTRATSATWPIYVLDALATGKITGAVGDKFTAGKLGEYTVEENADLGMNVLLGVPFIYNADNIDDFNW